MKTLEDFCKKNKLKLYKIRYRHLGAINYGWDIVKPPKNLIVCGLEPINCSSGNKWYVRYAHEDYKGPRYLKRVTKAFLNNLDINKPSSYFLKT